MTLLFHSYCKRTRVFVIQLQQNKHQTFRKKCREKDKLIGVSSVIEKEEILAHAVMYATGMITTLYIYNFFRIAVQPFYTYT